MNTMELVNRIPVDQSAKATPTIKKFLLEQIKAIRANREFIEKESRNARRLVIVEAYKKSIKFKQRIAKLEKLQSEIKSIKRGLREVGLTEDGNLLRIEKDSYYYDEDSRQNVDYTPEQIAAVAKVAKLIDAVSKETTLFSAMDQLETRMMLCSTVGETMAVVNAVAGRDVFKVEASVLKLQDKE